MATVSVQSTPAISPTVASPLVPRYPNQPPAAGARPHTPTQSALTRLSRRALTFLAAGVLTIAIVVTLVVLLVSLRGPGSEPGPPQSVPTTTVARSGTYTAYDIGMTWDDAKTYCVAKGQHLATITSAAEQAAAAQAVEEVASGIVVYW